MGVFVNGNGNRVAGRDYVEVKIKPCPRCEQRLIEPGMVICRHCHREQQVAEARNRLSAFFAATVVVFAFLLQRQIDKNVSMGGGDFAGLLSFSIAIVLLLVAVYVVVRDWVNR